MRVLVVDCYPSTHADAHVVGRAIAVLEAAGNQVDHLPIETDEFDAFMSAEERLAYETDEPLRSSATRSSAEAVQSADALLFCYPTVLFGPPPRLKSWLERVMVMGVAFTLDDAQRVRPAMKNIGRLGVITTTPHSRGATWRARDLGYRTFMRTVRLNCHPRCRRTFVRLAAGAPPGRFADRLNRSFAGWK